MTSNDTPMTAQLIDKLGLASFVAMSTLIIVCIGIGMVGVYLKQQESTWQQACIQAGGVPIQLDTNSFDCKVLDK